MDNWTKGKPTLVQALTGSDKYKAQNTHLTATLPGQVTQAKLSQGGGGNNQPTPSPGGSYKQYARRLLVTFGWGNQFSDLDSIIMAESSWNPRIKNNSSGALGIAQALGHGQGSATQGTLGNEYGGYGLSSKQAKEANSGNGYWQLVWMLHYIKQEYGTPAAAWAFHKSHNWY